jgi:hypothetical protein
LKSRQGAETDRETRRAIDAFRRGLEDNAIAVHGEIPPRAAAIIYSAMQAARVAMDEQREIDSESAKGWEPEQRTGKRQSVLKALAELTRYMRELGLPLGAAARELDPWAELNAEPPPPAAATEPQSPQEPTKDTPQ